MGRLLARSVAATQKGAADAAPPVQAEELTAQQWFERGLATKDLDETLRYGRGLAGRQSVNRGTVARSSGPCIKGVIRAGGPRGSERRPDGGWEGEQRGHDQREVIP